MVRLRLDNRTDKPLSLHWHGVRIRNAMDGVGGVTQPPVAPGASFTYAFTPPDAGTSLVRPLVVGGSSEPAGRGLSGLLVGMYFNHIDPAMSFQATLKGVVAHTIAGWGTPPTYHQPTDTIAALNLPLMTRAIQSLVRPVHWLANSDYRPAWRPGGRPTPNGGR